MRIVALDPGGTTGWAWYNTDLKDWRRGEIGPGEHHEQLYDLMSSLLPDVLIYERFNYQRRELTRGVSLNLDAVEYIGVIKLWYVSDLDGPSNVGLVCQTPAQGKISPGNFWTQDKLERLDLWIPSLRHAMDATGHILYYVTTTLKDNRFINQLRH